MKEKMIYPDVFQHDAACLLEKKLFLFDMDGTIYEEDRLFDGTLELLQEVRHRNGTYVFITNNSSRSVADYISKIHWFGIEADENSFFTSAQATALYLQTHYPNKRVYCQGTQSLLRELRRADILVTEEVLDDVEVVLVGFDTELTSQKLRNTCELLQRGLPFIATNPDLVCPVSFGAIPDCGSICGMLTNATGRTPIYIGKPEPTMIDIVREKTGYSAEETVVIGDRLYTDIAAGFHAGVTTIAVLTGESTIDDIKASSLKPTFTFASVKEIYALLASDWRVNAFSSSLTASPLEQISRNIVSA